MTKKKIASAVEGKETVVQCQGMNFLEQQPRSSTAFHKRESSRAVTYSRKAQNLSSPSSVIISPNFFVLTRQQYLMVFAVGAASSLGSSKTRMSVMQTEQRVVVGKQASNLYNCRCLPKFSHMVFVNK